MDTFFHISLILKAVRLPVSADGDFAVLFINNLQVGKGRRGSGSVQILLLAGI